MNAKCDVVMKLSVFGHPDKKKHTHTHTHKAKSIHPRVAGCNEHVTGWLVGWGLTAFHTIWQYHTLEIISYNYQDIQSLAHEYESKIVIIINYMFKTTNTKNEHGEYVTGDIHPTSQQVNLNSTSICTSAFSSSS